MMDPFYFLLVLTVLFGGFIMMFIWFYHFEADTSKLEDFRRPRSQGKPRKGQKKENLQEQANSKISKKKTKHLVNKAASLDYSHPELVTSLRGHTDILTGGDFSSNGKHFISSAKDRTLLIWSTKDLSRPDNKSTRINISYDHARHVCWSPDSKAFLISKEDENVVEVFKMPKREDGSWGKAQLALTLPQFEKDVEVLTLQIAVSGKFILTCTSKNELIIWSLKGFVLSTVSTKQSDTFSAKLSYCGRFIAATGSSFEVCVWNVIFGKDGSFEKLNLAYTLTGHTEGVYSCDFNSDASKVVTVSKDSTWRLYNTNEKKDDREISFLLSADYPMNDSSHSIVSLSPDSRTIIVANEASLAVYSAISGLLLNSIKDIYLGPIIDVKFEASSKYFLTLGDTHIRVFHNVSGYKATIEDLLRNKERTQSAAMKERIEGQIKTAKKMLKKFYP